MNCVGASCCNRDQNLTCCKGNSQIIRVHAVKLIVNSFKSITPFITVQFYYNLPKSPSNYLQFLLPSTGFRGTLYNSCSVLSCLLTSKKELIDNSTAFYPLVVTKAIKYIFFSVHFTKRGVHFTVMS